MTSEKHPRLAQKAAIPGSCEPYLAKIRLPSHFPHSVSVFKMDIRNPDGSVPDPVAYSAARVAFYMNGEWCADSPYIKSFTPEQEQEFHDLPFWN